MEQLPIPELRLNAQLLSRRPFDSAEETVRWFGAMQAQDERAATWAIALRQQEATRITVDTAIRERRVVRTWPMRGTLHFVPAEDAGWMLELLTPRVIAGAARRHRELELDERIFGHAAELIEVELLRRGRLTRPDVLGLLEGGGIETRGSRGSHILRYLAQTGLLCFGPREGKQETFVLLDEWVPASNRPGREEALATLAQRYFRSHGPGSLKDFTWWSGLPARDAREALEHAGDRLESLQWSGVDYWIASDVAPKASGPRVADQAGGEDATGIHLLPWFDEYLVGYQDRSAVLAPEFKRAVNAGGGLLNPVVVDRGRVVATWRLQRRKGTDSLVEVRPFGEWPPTGSESLQGALERYGRFLGERLEFEVEPRAV